MASIIAIVIKPPRDESLETIKTATKASNMFLINSIVVLLKEVKYNKNGKAIVINRQYVLGL